MMDKEEIIRRLKKISRHAVHVVGEPPLILSLDDGIALDEAIRLLKEQEPKKVIIDMYGNYCPWCSTETTRAMGVQKLHLGTKFCPYCGQAVKWG